MKELLFVNIGGPEMVLITFFGIIPLGLMIFSLVDIIRSKFSSSNTRVLWMIIVLVAPMLGALIYLAVGRSKKIS